MENPRRNIEAEGEVTNIEKLPEDRNALIPPPEKLESEYWSPKRRMTIDGLSSNTDGRDPIKIFNLQDHDVEVGGNSSNVIERFNPKPPKIFPWISTDGKAKSNHFFSLSELETRDFRNSFEDHSHILNHYDNPEIQKHKEGLPHQEPTSDGREIKILKNLYQYLVKLFMNMPIGAVDCNLFSFEVALLDALLRHKFPYLHLPPDRYFK
jgi:hypothetical protein